MHAMPGHDARRTGMDRLEVDFETDSRAELVASSRVDLSSKVARRDGHQARTRSWAASSYAEMGSKLARGVGHEARIPICTFGRQTQRPPGGGGDAAWRS